jgi:Gpi18-like mannosyltransferase
MKATGLIAGIRRIASGTSYQFSIFVRSRTAFLVLMAAAVIAKLLLSAFAPASYSLKDIIAWIDGSVSLGPWVALDAQIYDFWRSFTLSDATASSWWLASPATMSSNLRLLSLLLRLPSLMFDVGIAIVLYFLVAKHASARQARFASLLWFLNPYTTMAVELLAVPDAAVAFLTVVAVFLFDRKRIVLGSLFLAIGIAVKLYPILLLPAMLVYLRYRLATRRRSEFALIFLSLLGLAGYLAWDFQLGAALVVYVLTEYTPVTQPLNALFDYIVATHISPAAIALIGLYFGIWLFCKSSQITDTILPIFLVYYVFSTPYPQYYIWALPFMILDIVLLRRRHLAVLTVFLAFVCGYWFLSSAGFLTPSGYSLLLFPLDAQNLPWYSQGIVSFMKSSVTGVLLVPVLYAGLAAMTFIYALEIIPYWLKVEDSKPPSDT